MQELGSTKTYERISIDERSIVNTHFILLLAVKSMYIWWK